MHFTHAYNDKNWSISDVAYQVIWRMTVMEHEADCCTVLTRIEMCAIRLLLLLPVSSNDEYKWMEIQLQNYGKKKAMTCTKISANKVPTKQVITSSRRSSHCPPNVHHHHHHHHVPEGLGVLSCSLILKMKLVPPPLPWSSRVPSSFRSIL